MKQLFSILLVVVLFVVLGACGNNPNHNNTPNREQNYNSNSSTKGVSEQQFIEDVSKHKNVVHCFDSKFVESNDYIYKEHKIIKRQTNIEDKEDIIHCSILAESNYISVNMSVTATYGYYDVGGWVLDDLYVNEKEAIPLIAPSKNIIYNEFTSALQNKKNKHNDNEYEKSKSWINYLSVYSNESANADCYVDLSDYIKELEFGEIKFNQAAKTAQINVSFKSSLAKIQGYIPFGFNDKTGWFWNDSSVKESLKPYIVYKTSSIENYKEAIGIFRGRLNQWDSISEFEIFEINEKNITYAFLTGWNPEVKRTATFDPISGEFWVNGHCFMYNPNIKSWEEVYGGDKAAYYRQN